MGPKKQSPSHKAARKRNRSGPGSSSGNIDGIQFGDDRQEEKNEKLVHRKIVPIRYVDWETLETLELEDNVRALLQVVGWDNFMANQSNTYVGLTLEFLSSFIFHEDRSNLYNPNHYMTFRLFNTEYQLSLTKFCEGFNWRNEGHIHDGKITELRQAEFNAGKFWDEIATIGPYEARTAKATQIHNLVFWYIQRAMENTVFGGGYCGGVRVGELFCLWSMLNNQTINTGFYLAHQLHKVAEADNGDIVVGGLITSIAYNLNLGPDVEKLKVVPGKMKINIDVCTNKQMIKSIPIASGRVNFCLLVFGQDSICLADRANTNINDRRNWLYRGRIGLFNHRSYREPQPEPRVKDQPSSSSNVPNWQEWCTRVEGEQQRQGAELQVLREE